MHIPKILSLICKYITINSQNLNYHCGKLGKINHGRNPYSGINQLKNLNPNNQTMKILKSELVLKRNDNKIKNNKKH